MASNRITKVAVVGAGGNCGSFIVEALLKTGKHTVTAITRADSQSKLPAGVTTRAVNYEKPETLVEALKGHDALVITLGGMSPKGTESRLVHAAADAGVPWILPNEWAADSANEDLVKDVSLFQAKGPFSVRGRNIDRASMLTQEYSYVAVSTGFWYEWSLAIAPSFGFDFANRSVTFFDDGETKISVSTWPQVGRAVAALLSLPIHPEGNNKEAFLNNFRNKVVYVKSFTISQKDMLEPVMRVTGTTKDDWAVSHEPSHERFATGVAEIKEGKKIGFAKWLYTRVFFPDGTGDVESKHGTINRVLGLPEEDIDEATKVAQERSKLPSWT